MSRNTKLLVFSLWTTLQHVEQLMYSYLPASIFVGMFFSLLRCKFLRDQDCSTTHQKASWCITWSKSWKNNRNYLNNNHWNEESYCKCHVLNTVSNGARLFKDFLVLDFCLLYLHFLMTLLPQSSCLVVFLHCVYQTQTTTFFLCCLGMKVC